MNIQLYKRIKVIGIGIRIAGLLLLLCCMGFTFSGKNESGSDKIIDLEVKTDSSSFTLSQVLDSTGQTRYFYRDIDQFPCDDSVCERMHVRIYWDTLGKYLKLSTEHGSGLTKLNHKPFRTVTIRNLTNCWAIRNRTFGIINWTT